MLNETELKQRFGAVKAEGETVAKKFQDFVKSLADDIPEGISRVKLVNALEDASKWAHNALNMAEIEARKFAHQRAKSGEKPSTAPKDAPAPTVVPTQEPAKTE